MWLETCGHIFKLYDIHGDCINILCQLIPYFQPCNSNSSANYAHLATIKHILYFYLFIYFYTYSQILPVNIKGLAGSVATLANWFIAWVITMTAPLLLTWSSGGYPSLSLYYITCRDAYKPCNKHQVESKLLLLSQ